MLVEELACWVAQQGHKKILPGRKHAWFFFITAQVKQALAFTSPSKWSLAAQRFECCLFLKTETLLAEYDMGAHLLQLEVMTSAKL